MIVERDPFLLPRVNSSCHCFGRMRRFNCLKAWVTRTKAHHIFTANSGVPRLIARSVVTSYDAWKHFTHKSILRIIVKYTKHRNSAHRQHFVFVGLAEVGSFSWTSICTRNQRKRPYHGIFIEWILWHSDFLRNNGAQFFPRNLKI